MTIRIQKWTKGIAPDDPIGKAAIRTLRPGLGAVKYYLQLAARKANKDIEHVHNLRVWTRRATAALKLYEELLPKREMAWFEKQLKRIRHAAGNARDYDMLRQSLVHDSPRQVLRPCLKRIHDKRKDAQAPLIAIHKRLTHGDRFDRKTKKLLRALQREHGAKTPSFGPWAHIQLQPIVKAFFAAAPDKKASEKTLHEFRIRGKELRCAMELLAEAFPPDFRRKLYSIVENLQDELGRINDLATAKARLRQLRNDTRDAAEKKQLLHLLAQQRVRLEQAQRDFLDRCTPQFIAELHAHFHDMLKLKRVRQSQKHRTIHSS